MVIISKKKKFIFIHIYKNAGNSIKNLLHDYHNPKYTFKHPHYKAKNIKETLGDKYSEYISFVVIRNPWDWQVSLYHYMLKDKEHHQHEFIKSLGNFDNYIKWRCEKEVRYQTTFLLDDDNNCIVDYILKFENLNEDMKKMCEIINIPYQSLPHINPTKHNNYKSYYTEETKDLVYKAFKKDIEAFGYKF